jgi:hypothetical protein
LERGGLLMGMGAATMMTALLEERAQGQDSDTVYELRIYHLNEGKLDLILDRFRTKETKIFARVGMHGVAYWVPTEEPLAGRTLIYLLRHHSREAAKQSWAKFAADPEWIALKAETEKNGEFVNKHKSTFMKRADFSPEV